MIELFEKTEVPYDRGTIMSINEKVVHGARNRKTIAELNTGGRDRTGPGSFRPNTAAITNPSSSFINETGRDISQAPKHAPKRQVPDLVKPIRKAENSALVNP